MDSEAPPGANPVATKPAGSRQHLLDTAAHLFSTIGFTESGMRQIAQVAGMQTASVYYHFASKDLILLEVLKAGLEYTAKAVYAAVAALPADANARDRVEAAIAAHLRAVHSNLSYTSVDAKFAGQLPADVAAIIHPLHDEYVRYWRILLEQAHAEKLLREELPTSLTRALIIGMIQRTTVWFDAKVGPVDVLIAAVLNMLRGMWVEPAANPKIKPKTKPKTKLKSKASTSKRASSSPARKSAAKTRRR